MRFLVVSRNAGDKDTQMYRDKVVQKLKEVVPHLDYVITSPFRRCVHTTYCLKDAYRIPKDKQIVDMRLGDFTLNAAQYVSQLLSSSGGGGKKGNIFLCVHKSFVVALFEGLGLGKPKVTEGSLAVFSVEPLE